MGNNNTLQTERLINYLDGEMNGAEKDVLIKELELDVAMQRELDNLLLATEVVKSYGLRERVAGIHKVMMNEIATTTVKHAAPVRHLGKRIMKYAAGIVLLAFVFSLYQYLNVSANKLYQTAYSQYTIAQFRGDDTIPAIEKAFQEKKYDQVIANFNTLPNASVKDYFLTGQAYLIKENYPSAVSCFKTVQEKNSYNSSSLLLDDAEYYLALCYLKSNKINDAMPLFKKINDNKKHLYYDKVSGWFLLKLQLLKWKQ